MFEYVADSMITVCLWSSLAGDAVPRNAIAASHAIFALICAAILCKIVAIGA